MEVKFREAGEADARKIAELLDVLGHPAKVSEVERRLTVAEPDPQQSVIIAEAEEAVAAFASLVFVPFFHLGQNLCRVSALAVDTTYQRRGIGRMLMEEVERVARERDCAGIEVTSSGDRTGAHSFYAELGYEQSSLKFRKRLNRG